MPEKLLNFQGFAGICVIAARCRALSSNSRKSVNLVNSEAGYVTIHVTKLRRRLRHTGNGMSRSSKKPSFVQDLVEAMKLVVAHHRGEIELEQMLPRPRAPKSAYKPRTRRTK